MQFYDSEIKVLNILWRYGELAEEEVAKLAELEAKQAEENAEEDFLNIQEEDSEEDAEAVEESEDNE